MSWRPWVMAKVGSVGDSEEVRLARVHRYRSRRTESRWSYSTSKVSNEAGAGREVEIDHTALL